jgi:Tol biopolymer transport system component
MQWDASSLPRLRMRILRLSAALTIVLAQPFLPVDLRRVAGAAGPASQPSAPGPGASSSQERTFLSRIRRLTVEGARSGEGYWSPDGTRMVFQSERDATNPFYQIYVLDLGTGDVSRISPGIGKTTCAFFRPNSDEILFGSTHADPKSRELQDEELAFRASGRERRYAWDYDSEMDIYVYAERTGRLTRLTDARGYDAEAGYSPDGQWIVFSSTRDAYNRALSETEQRFLAADPSYFADIYIMRADGSEQRRLTTAAGYDGGPFFTYDGSRIVWRRFDERGLIADVWTMKRDGSEAIQVTDFGAMSWAPYEHPSGEYILFASNKLGFENFELFMVDARGVKEPVRVTYSDGFDGLPVPSPDGARLSWTSTRSGGGAGQIFLADWNHARALEAIRQAPERQ